jgi:biopolymer transport protein TolR
MLERNRRRRRRGLMAEINVVPYIDVMLVLLVIFMVTAPLLTQGIQVNLPRTQAKAIDPSSQMPIVLSIRSDGRYFLNVSSTPTDPVSPQATQARVMALLTLAQQKHEKAPGVYVKADASVNYGTVASAMALLQRAGADSVGLITQNID